jgi:hypothetical protein
MSKRKISAKTQRIFKSLFTGGSEINVLLEVKEIQNIEK